MRHVQAECWRLDISNPTGMNSFDLYETRELALQMAEHLATTLFESIQRSNKVQGRRVLRGNYNPNFERLLFYKLNGFSHAVPADGDQPEGKEPCAEGFEVCCEVDSDSDPWTWGCTFKVSRQVVDWEVHESLHFGFIVTLEGQTAITDELEEVLHPTCDDATLHSTGSKVMLTFNRHADTYQDAVVSALSDIRAAGLKPGDVEPEEPV